MKRKNKIKSTVNNLDNNSHCLMNTAILRREHMIFLASSAKNSSIPNKKIEQKLLSHNCGSIG